MKIQAYIVLMLCLILKCNGPEALSQQLTFTHYGVNNGISQSEIKCIHQDEEGYIWIGTQNGLNKYDGYSFENFYYDPTDIKSISNNWIFAIAEDSVGNLWVGTKEGLNRYNKKTGEFTVVPHKIDDAIVPDNFVYGLCTDSSYLYINSPPLISRYNYRTDRLESFSYSQNYDGALHDIGFPILKSSDGTIWLGSTDGLTEFDQERETFYVHRYDGSNNRSISHNHITALCEDNIGNILVGTENGLNFYNKYSKDFIRFEDEAGHDNILSHNYVLSILQDSYGVYWIGTQEGGLNRLNWSWDIGNFDLTLYRSGLSYQNYIGHDIVYSLFEDRSKNLWVGTINGLDRADLKTKKFRSYKKTDDANSLDLLDNIIASVYIDEDQRLWIGNWGKGLNIYNPATEEMLHYTSESTGDKKIPNNHVHVLFEDSQSQLWMGTRNGVSIFSKQQDKFIPFAVYFALDDNDFFNNNRVYCITEISNGEIWIGTGSGIMTFNSATKELGYLRADAAEPFDISSNLVYSILEDKDGCVWIATMDGLDCYELHLKQMSHFRHNSEIANSLCDNFTISLCEHSNGEIWIGTSSGVNQFNKKDSTFTYFSIKDGLPSNIVYDIVEDENQDLWFSTGSGLVRYSASKQRFKSFSVSDGLQGVEFNLKAVFQANNGDVYFGGMDGLVAFHPDSLHDNKFIPPVVLTSFVKENAGQKKEFNVYSDEVKLSYKDYSFTIEYAALDYTEPHKNQYAYKMVGLRDEWEEVGNRNFVHFTNLPSGDYIFMVKGTNNDGVWNDVPTRLHISISPPWWHSKYAYTVYILGGTIIVIGVIRLRERSLKREKRLLEKGIQERTAEIALQKDRVEESEAKLKSTISSLNDLVFVLDRDGIFQEFYNPGNTDPLYENPDFYLKKHYQDVGFPLKVIEELKAAFQQLQKSDAVHEFDYCVNHDDMCWYNAKISPRHNAQGGLTGITIVARHITERKRAEEQMRQQKEELNELNATKDKFFSIMAHDLKNPFASLYSMSQAVDENYADLDEEDKLLALRRIHQSAELIYNLLENLLTWSKSQSGRMEYNPGQFDLSTLIQENINLHTVPAEKKGLCLKAVVADTCRAYGDSQMINTVLRNLVNNAVKFTEAGKEVVVSVRQNDKFLEVEVRDQGVGISKENLEKLFRIDVKYKTVGTSGEKGTGLGLILCYEFIIKNGGNIWCESELGKGSSFFFTVPCKK